MTVLIQALSPEDGRSRLRSGNIDLDRLFRRFAGQGQLRAGGTTVLGFVTVAAASIESSAVPAAQRRKLPAYPLPILLLARLAVDQGAQSRGVGHALLRFAFTLAREAAKSPGCAGVVVDAKADPVDSYARFGLLPLDVEMGLFRDRPEPRATSVELGAIPRPAGE